MQEIVLAALIAHFKSVIETSAGMPFAETKVFLPTASFDGYAHAVAAALGGALPVYDIKQE